MKKIIMLFTIFLLVGVVNAQNRGVGNDPTGNRKYIQVDENGYQIVIDSSGITTGDSLVALATEDAIKQDSLITVATEDAIKQDSLITLSTEDAVKQDSVITLATEDAIKQDSVITLATEDAIKQDSLITLATSSGLGQDSLITLATVDAVKQDSLITLQTEDAIKQDSVITLGTADATKQDSLVTLADADATKQDSVITLGTADATKQDSIITLVIADGVRQDSIIVLSEEIRDSTKVIRDRLTDIDTNTDGLEAKQDTIIANINLIEALTALIKTAAQASKISLDSLASAIVSGEMQVSVTASGALATETKQDLAIDTLAVMYARLDSLVNIINDMYDGTNSVLKNIEQAPRHYTASENLFTAGVGDTATTTWADMGAEISMIGYTKLGVWVTIDINSSENIRIRALGKHTSAGAEEYVLPISTVSSSDIQVAPEYVEFPDADNLYLITWTTEGVVPYLQLQYQSSDTGGLGQVDQVYITKSWR